MQWGSRAHAWRDDKGPYKQCGRWTTDGWMTGYNVHTKDSLPTTTTAREPFSQLIVISWSVRWLLAVDIGRNASGSSSCDENVTNNLPTYPPQSHHNSSRCVVIVVVFLPGSPGHIIVVACHVSSNDYPHPSQQQHPSVAATRRNREWQRFTLRNCPRRRHRRWSFPAAAAGQFGSSAWGSAACGIEMGRRKCVSVSERNVKIAYHPTGQILWKQWNENNFNPRLSEVPRPGRFKHALDAMVDGRPSPGFRLGEVRSTRICLVAYPSFNFYFIFF